MCRRCGILVGTSCNETVEPHSDLCIFDSAQMAIRFSPLYARFLLFFTTVDVLVLLGSYLISGELVTYSATLILLNLSLIHNLKSYV